MPISPLPPQSALILPMLAGELLAPATSTENLPLNWRSNPNYRGTLNILFSCLTTLFLCAWTVLHLDVPTRKEGLFTKFMRKFGWFCVALFAPHIFLIIAFNQRYLASGIFQKIKEHRLDIPKPHPSRHQRLYRYLRQTLSACFTSRVNGHTGIADQPIDLGNTTILDQDQGMNDLNDATRAEPLATSSANNIGGQQSGKISWEHPWGMQHAFYACMGGYVFDFRRDPPFLPCGDTRITVTPFGLVWLMEHYPKLIPDIPVESIEDRSKSDALAKTLVVLQVLWFCTNLVARGASKLPITLLEISTLAHAITALLIYILWWDKPHDITLPTPITGPQAREACALMSILSPTCRPMLAGLWTLRCDGEWFRSLHRSLDDNDVRVANRRSGFGIRRGEGVTGSIFAIRRDYSPEDVPSEWTLGNFRLYLLFGPACLRPWFIVPSAAGLFSNYSGFDVKQVDEARWRLASNAVLFLEGPQIGSWEIKPHRKQEALLVRHSTPASFFRSLSTFELYGDHLGLFSRILGESRGTLTISIALALYGAPHLFAWSAQYPSSVERLLWQISTVALLSPGASALAVWANNGLGQALDDSGVFNNPFGKVLDYVLKALLICLLIAGALTVMLYPVASAYLVVESFRQLLYLSDAAYDIPSWSGMWPHVS